MAKKRTTKKKSQGLGDTVEAITEATGIKSAIKWINGNEDCGECEKRKNILNRLIPYKKPNPLTETQYNFLKELMSKHHNEHGFTGTLKPTEANELIKVYNDVFNDNQSASTCSKCYVRYISHLKKVVDSYEQ